MGQFQDDFKKFRIIYVSLKARIKPLGKKNVEHILEFFENLDAFSF